MSAPPKLSPIFSWSRVRISWQKPISPPEYRLKTIACTVSFSLFYSIIPSPSVPIVDDYLTSCLLGGR